MSGLPNRFKSCLFALLAASQLTFAAHAGEGVLLLGDSHFTGPVSPGTFLDRELRLVQPKLTTYGDCTHAFGPMADALQNHL